MCLIPYSYIIIYIKWENATMKGLTEGMRGVETFPYLGLQQNLIGN